MSGYTERTGRLLGAEAMEVLKGKKVTVVGLGGVGGMCAEALARSGVGAMHLVDFDTVCDSNLNRQIFADKSTVGMKKTEAALRRLSLVCDCVLTAADGRVDENTAPVLVPSDSDFVVDAIDDIPAKLALALLCRERGTPEVCCLGAGNRLSPASFTVKDIFSTEGDPLARRMRQLLRKAGVSSLPAVISCELPQKPAEPGCIGSFMPATAGAGLTAAAYTVKTLLSLSR